MAGARDKRSIDSLDDIYREAISAPELEVRQQPEGLSEDFLSGDVFSADGSADGSFGQIILHSLVEHDPGWRGKEVALAADKMRVTVRIRGGKELSSYQLNHGLEQLGVRHGIIWEALTQVEQQSRAGLQGEVVVACGTPAEPRLRIDFAGIQRVAALDGSIFWLAEGVKLDSRGVRTAFGAEQLAGVEANPIIAKAVKAGEVLVSVYRNPAAKPGMDVLGEPVDPSDDILPVAGENVRFDESRGVYESLTYGYLVCEDNTLSVQPPIWLSPDYRGAYYVNCSQIGAPVYPSADDLISGLRRLQVAEGTIRNAIIEKMCGHFAQGQHLSAKTVKIAEAIPPKPGRDAKYVFAVDLGETPDVIRRDETIDLTGRNAVVCVAAGDLVAEKITATKAVRGVDLLGAEIAAEDGKEQTLSFADSFRIEERDGKFFYYATKAGNIRFVQNQLAIVDVHTVDGNVDAACGNIDREEDLQINGSVMAGLSVRSKGNIAITGSVYNGAKVMAGGDISVGEGIIGGETRVVALGNLGVVFVQEAEVIVKGNAKVLGYLFNAVLRANGRIDVCHNAKHGKKSGRIIGGLTCSSQEIVVSRVGHAGQPDTVLAILPDPEYSGQLKRLDEEGRNCRESIARISRSLPFEQFDPAVIKKALAQLPEDKKEAVVKLLGTFNNLIKRQQNIEQLRKEIHGKILSGLRAGVIRVTHDICQGSELQFGEKKLVIAVDSEGATYTLQGGEIV